MAAPGQEKRTRKKPLLVLRLLGGLLAVLFALILAAAATVFLVPLAETVDRTEIPGSADWMAGLEDGIRLSAVTLPGTHNSGTAAVDFPFFAKCQVLGVREQLEAGFRYLDIRLAADEETGALKLTHGFSECRPAPFSRKPLWLSDVIADCLAFLDGHPTECFLFCVKHEYGDASVVDMQTALYAEISRSRDRWLLTSSLPTVGEARGRIVLLRRWGDDAGLGDEAGIPFSWADQGGLYSPADGIEANFTGDFLLWVQDRYHYGAEEKWEVFLDGLGIGIEEDEAAVHFLSTVGTLAYSHPRYFASRLNPKLTGTALPEGPVGWIVVDYGSASLAEHIYGHNFR